LNAFERRAPTIRWAALAILVAAGCVNRHEYGPAETGPPNPWCERVRPDRGRVKVLLAEGKLDRAIRVMQRVEGNCREDAELTWADHVAALAEIGRAAEARQLAGIIDDSPRATAVDKKAAAAAREAAAAHDARIGDPERGKEQAAIELRRAVAAGEAADAVGRERAALASYKAFHPNARALVEAGLGALAAGRRVDAQRLFDRAAYDDPSTPIRPEVRAASPLEEGASALALSPNGERIAASALGFVNVFDATLRLVRRIGVDGDITSMVFVKGGRELIVGLGDGRTNEIEVPMGIVGRELSRGRGAVRALAVSPDEKRLAIAHEDGALSIVELGPGKTGATARAPGAVQLAFRPDGGAVAWASVAGEIGLVDPANGKATPLAHVHGPLRAIAFSSPHEIDVITATERLRFDTARAGAPRTIASHLNVDAAAGTSAAFAVLEKGVIGVRAAAGDEKANTVYGVKAPPMHEDPTAIAASPEGKRAVVAWPSRRLDLVDVTGESQKLSPPSTVESLAARGDGRALAVGAASGEVHVIDLAGGGSKTLEVHTGAHARVAFAPDGSLAAGGEAGTVTLFDPSGKKRGEARLDAPIGALAFGAGGTRLAFGGRPAWVRVVDANGAGGHDLQLDGGDVRALAFSPGGDKLLIAAAPGVTLWDLATGKGERYTAFGKSPRAVAWAREGNLFGVARSDATLALGAVGKPSPTEVVPMLVSPFDLYFTPERLVVVEGDGSVAMRHPPGKVLERLREPGAAARVATPLPVGLAAGMNDGSIRMFLPGRARAVAMVWPVAGGAVITATDGHVDASSASGPPSVALVCRLGAVAYPFEVCAEQFIVKDLLGVALAGRDPAEADP
jgi:WD40 repeat protein